MGALYRRVRPTRFKELEGQPHVKEVLQNAIREGRLAQAYLFSGPRGVGKTTVARLLAMAVGCEAPAEERPCGRCAHCRAVAEGRHPDVLEIDAASNNSVEDVRELKERILLAPVMAPKKVIILDEAHMMSKSAFNALLKTLEEPPEHVLFIFATTEPERMPATVRSRTQHFRFHRLKPEEIVAKLRRIAEAEGLAIDDEALWLIAEAADGAMRDAESLLDRVLAMRPEHFGREEAEALLGLPPERRVAALAEALLAGALEALRREAEGLYTAGFAPRTLVRALKKTLRARFYQDPVDARPLRAALALDEAEERLAKEEGRLGLDFALLKAWMALEEAPVSPRPPVTKAPSAKVKAPPKQNEGAGSPAESAPARGTDPLADYSKFLAALPAVVRAFVREARPELKGKTLRLVFRPAFKFHYERTQAQLARLRETASRVLGVEAVEAALEEDEEGPRAETPAPVEEVHPSPPPEPEEVQASLAEEDWLRRPEVQRLVELFGARLKARGQDSG